MVAQQEDPRLAFSLEHNQINYQIILNTQEIDVRTDKTNCTNRRRNDATSKKVESAETWFGRETDLGCCRGNGALVAEKGEWVECTRICTKITLPQSHQLGNQEGLIFVSFCNQLGSKTGDQRSRVWLGQSPECTVLPLERRHTSNPGADGTI